jgi:hypothetical protein
MVAAALVLFASVALAQQQPQESMPGMKMPAPPDKTQDKTKPPAKDESMQGMDMSGHSHGSTFAEHAHFSSGTGWQPIDAAENMWMWSPGGWDVMLHGNLFVTSNNQGGPRGASKLESMSMAMLMEQKQVGRGMLIFREMFSGDALTVPHPGFPELFQTGETYRGRPLIDHQHPHDVFSELSGLYDLNLSRHASWFVYGGPAAEPALGPVAFVHRASAAELPLAPLGHHLQDSTHISYGVVTSGFTLGNTKDFRGAMLKVEASAFNGREPDEHRATIDLGALDSWSFRAGLNLGTRWSGQYSVGHLVHPEALETGDVQRQTASLAYSRLIPNGHWCTTLIWGRNRKELTQTQQNSYLLESVVNFAKLNYLTTRLELVDKDELLSPGPTAHAPTLPPSSRIGAYTVGGVRDLVHNSKLNLGIGANVTAYSKPAALDPIYGKHPVSWEVFVRIRPGTMKH